MKFVSVSAEGIGELIFDGVSAVMSSLDCGYPEIARPSLTKNTLYGAELLTPSLGACTVTAKGYLLPGNLSVDESRHMLTRIVGTGGEFTLAVGELRRTVSAQSLTFCSDPGYGAENGEKFTLVMISADPFFEGAERVVSGVPDVAGGIVFPTDGTTSVGTALSNGTITAENRGDNAAGFVMELDFPAAAAGFVLVSDREEGTFAITRTIAAGEHLTVDTRTGRKGVTDASGASILGDLTEKCRFHSVLPGMNVFSWKCVSAAAPRIALRFTEGYLSPEEVE